MSHTVPYRQRLAQRCAGYPTAGIIGATMMPQMVYLHSALTESRVVCRDVGERRELLRWHYCVDG